MQFKTRAHGLLQAMAALRQRKALPVLVICLAGFILLSFLTHWPGMQAADLAVTRLIQRPRNDALTRLAVSFTFLGNTATLVALGACAAIIFFFYRKPWAALLSMVTLLSLPLNVLLKDLVGRPRPAHNLVDVILPAVGLSFPSGHAMASTMFYGFLALMSWVHIPNRSTRNVFTAMFTLIAVFISLSRVYVGAHWFSDVLGGWTAGLFFLFILAEVYQSVAKAELAPAPVIGAHASARS